MKPKKEVIYSAIWHEQAETDNPFAAARCYAGGYDVYGELLHKASWIEYLYLLFHGERPDKGQTIQLERLAIALANPGPRDHSVRAAMNGGVGGSTNAACLMAALGVGAGQFNGAHEVALAMHCWQHCDTNLEQWRDCLQNPPNGAVGEFWPDLKHAPGFDPYGESCPTPIKQTLELLIMDEPSSRLRWLSEHRNQLEEFANGPLAMTGIAAAVFMDLNFSIDQAEMLFLMLRLPGAAVHALEQRKFGWRRYPFFSNGLHLKNDPGAIMTTETETESEI
ncbi:MAG: citryl-CoA lyase [Gammaproteobacteria bacterium]